MVAMRRVRLPAAFVLIAMLVTSSSRVQAALNQQAQPAHEPTGITVARHVVSAFGNPAALTRAANALRRHEHDRALLNACSVLSQRPAFDVSELDFDLVARSKDAVGGRSVVEFVQDADSRHWTADAGQLLLLTVFSTSDGTPPPAKYKDHEYPYSLMAPLEKTWPVVWLGGIPFDLSGVEAHAVPDSELGQYYSMTTVPNSTLEFVCWAHKHGKRGKGEVVLPDRLFHSVDTELERYSSRPDVIKLIGNKGIRRLQSLVRGQALRALEAVLDIVLVSAGPSLRDVALESNEDITPLWTFLSGSPLVERLRWNSITQAYELTGD